MKLNVWPWNAIVSNPARASSNGMYQIQQNQSIASAKMKMMMSTAFRMIALIGAETASVKSVIETEVR